MKIWVPIVVGLGLVSLLLYLIGIKGFVILIGVLMLVFMALLYFRQNALLFLPTIQVRQGSIFYPVGSRHPSQHNLQSIDHGVIIRGWHLKTKPEKRRRIIVHFHEKFGNIGGRLEYAKFLLMFLGSDVVMVSYRGYYHISGQPTEQGLMRDAYAVMKYAISYSKKNNNLPIYIFGRSLGGAVAINLAIQQPYKNEITGLILQNTFTSISDFFPILKQFKFLQRNYWPSIDRIPLVKIPILFIKSVQDETIPHEQMNRLHLATTSSRVMQYRIKQGTHNRSWDLQPEIYFPKLEEFFIRVQQ